MGRSRYSDLKYGALGYPLRRMEEASKLIRQMLEPFPILPKPGEDRELLRRLVTDLRDKAQAFLDRLEDR